LRAPGANPSLQIMATSAPTSTPAPAPTPPPTPSQPPVEILYAVPVGTVISWYPPATAFSVDSNDGNTKTLICPPGFAVCDGSVVKDPLSPFNGQTLPDLRNRFILGLNTGDAGATGGYDVTVGWQNPQFITSPTSANTSDNVQNYIIQDHSPTTSWRYVLAGEDGINDGNHHHYVLGATFTVPPPAYATLILLIRIK